MPGSKKERLLKDLDDLFGGASSSSAKASGGSIGTTSLPSGSVVRHEDSWTQQKQKTVVGLPKRRRRDDVLPESATAAATSLAGSGAPMGRVQQQGVGVPVPLSSSSPSLAPTGGWPNAPIPADVLAVTIKGDVALLDGCELLSRGGCGARARDGALSSFMSRHIGNVADTERGRAKLDALLDSKLRGRTLLLQNTVTKSKKSSKGQRLGAEARKRAKLHLSKKSLKKRGLGALSAARQVSYEDCFVVHKLWKDYVEKAIPRGSSAKAAEKKLKEASVQGAFVRVMNCGIDSLVGKKGILVEECPSMWLLMCEDKKLRQVPKECSELAFLFRETVVKLDGPTRLVK